MSDGDLLLEDPRTLRALAHPARLAILDHLGAAGTATATACGAAVGVSPSAASYHLRALARYGLVEEADGGRGRERPWRSRGAGFSFEPSAATGPAGEAASMLLSSQLVESGERWTREYIRGESQLPQEWRQASHLANKTLVLTPAEARELVERLEAVLRPYLRSGRDESPDAARNVRLLLRLFPRELPPS
ncbi:MAG: helix-turn-helix domain-containing protein [Gaiellaceae bacterium MAG52_C11]|nr:helix-turn-helix domain-containing protein [Candidatus Gaiellasilicea maunaloa]